MKNSVTDVYFFATCLIDQFLPQAGLDAINLIEHLGVRVHFPDEQTCCGQPAYTSGFPEAARNVALQQLFLFPENWLIVVPSGSCAGMFKHHYKHLFADSKKLAAATNVAERVIEFSEFLVHYLQFHRTLAEKIFPTDLPQAVESNNDQATNIEKSTDSPSNHNFTMREKIAVHTSCSARRELGTHLFTEQILSPISAAGLIEQCTMSKQEECCGFGGTFSVRHPEISAAMVSDKCKAICASSAQKVISADAGCLLNILKHAENQADTKQITGEHLASFLWRVTAKHLQ